jgi:bifunctional enzyme CysN/CysC
MNDAGLICLASFIAPEEAVRQKAAEVIGRERFIVVHLEAPIELCRQRDQEGLYEKADEGEIANFPGVSAPYEPPVKPDLILNTSELKVDQCVERVVTLIEGKIST